MCNVLYVFFLLPVLVNNDEYIIKSFQNKSRSQDYGHLNAQNITSSANNMPKLILSYWSCFAYMLCSVCFTCTIYHHCFYCSCQVYFTLCIMCVRHIPKLHSLSHLLVRCLAPYSRNPRPAAVTRTFRHHTPSVPTAQLGLSEAAFEEADVNPPDRRG